MRIFYLTTEFPWPAHSGGRVHSLAQVRLLASLPEVAGITLLSLAEVAVTQADRDALSREVPGVVVLPPVNHPIHLLQQPHALWRVAWLRLSRGVPYLAGKWDSAAIRSEIARRLGEGPFDLVYIDHLGMARYLPEIRARCPRARLVLEEHNVESDLFRQFAARQRLLPLRLVAQAEWHRARDFEARMLRAADAVVAISAEDAAALQQLAGAGPGPAALDPVVVPQVVTFTRREEEAPAAGAGPRLCYVGNLTWHPNVQGLDWFLAEVWPLLRRRLPGVALTIAGSGLATGSDGRPQVPSRWQVPGVEVVGFLPDLEPLYRRSLVMIVPILSGSGIRIKLLEALRAGMPVVSTPQGAAGLPLRDGAEALIEGDPEGFAAAVVRLCGDDGLRRRLREAGYRYLSAHHSESAAQGAMRRALGLPPKGTADEPHT